MLINLIFFKTILFFRGTSGIVYEVQNKANGLFYALKVIRKLDWQRDKLVRSEVSILKDIYDDHIINLYEVFENQAEISLILDLANGGELFDKLVQLKTYSEDDARELIRTVLQTLDYIHSQGIVHRDLKPENLLLPGGPDSNLVEVKLSDFGMAAKIQQGELMYQQCGSEGYIAPEVLTGQGYGTEVDMWSLGCISYILLSGYPPYRPISFPGPEWDRVSPAAVDFVSKLLEPNPNFRMNAAEALKHRWLNFPALEHDLKSAHSSLKQLHKPQK
jgi:calcium/calmodulin-dependent protein kinase I